MKKKLIYLFEQNHPLLLLLSPVSWVYRLIIWLRRLGYQQRLFPVYTAPRPVIVVGNITMGGSGKTPIVIALANELAKKGVVVGIISRGYRSNAPYYPFEVFTNTPVLHSGDEPLLIKNNVSCPVVIGANREKSCEYLIKNYPAIQCILSDDGLQHYRLHRDVELIVFGQTFFKNSHRLFPSGDLREPLSRLKANNFLCLYEDNHAYENHQSKSQKAQHRIMEYASTEVNIQQNSKIKDITLIKNLIQKVNLKLIAFINLKNGVTQNLKFFAHQECHAICAIAHPQRFFQTLKQLDIDYIAHHYPDHFHFTEKEFSFADNTPILMTEKDAVKCASFATEQMWYLKIGAEFQDTCHFIELILKNINY